MTKYLAENLINLSSRGFRPNRSPKLSLNHSKGGLSIRPFVIMLEKDFLIEFIEMPHAIPQTIEAVLLAPNSICPILEGDKGSSTNSLYCVQVLTARVCLISLSRVGEVKRNPPPRKQTYGGAALGPALKWVVSSSQDASLT